MQPHEREGKGSLRSYILKGTEWPIFWYAYLLLTLKKKKFPGRLQIQGSPGVRGAGH